MRKSYIYLLLIIIIGLLFGLLSLNGKNADENAFDPVLSDSLSSAELHYKNSCAGCHGADFEEFFDREWIFGNSHKDIFKITKHGDEDMGMPAFGGLYSDEQIEAITNLILKEINKEENQDRKFKNIPDNISAINQNFKTETIVENIGIPWGMVFLPDGDMLITLKAGKLFRFSKGKLSSPIGGVPAVNDRGQGGLLDIFLHPNYQENGWIYISYSAPAENGRGSNTAVMRAKLENNTLIDQQVIYKAEPDLTTNHHYGSRFAFDKNGYLFFSVGDRGKMDDAQDLSKHNGKIHRIHDDGSIPDDNPFVNRANAIPSIYSYGHRNPQGLVIHPETGELWSHEHGPKGGDEINIVEAGKNYGWPVISYGINYDGSILTTEQAREGMEQPLLYWTPSIAPCGMAFVSGDKYPGWKGNLLVGSLSFKYLERLEISSGKVTKQVKLLEDIGRVRNVILGPDGYIYVSVEGPGRILKLVPAVN
jgi:aldose sugar dehydrogenase